MADLNQGDRDDGYTATRPRMLGTTLQAEQAECLGA